MLAIDRNFSNFVKKKVTGKQIIQDELKLSNLLPEINLSLFKDQPFQDSQLEVGNLSGEEFIGQEDFVVRVRVLRTKVYSGRQLIFLSVTEKQLNQQTISPFKHNYRDSVRLMKQDLP